MRKYGQKFSEDVILDIFRDRHKNRYRYLPFPEDFTIRSHISIICPIHGEFRQSIVNHMRGAGCRICAHTRINTSNCLGRIEWIRRFESVHGRAKYDYSKVPEDVKQSTKVEIFCPDHNVSFYQTPNQHWRFRQGCPKCGIIKKVETRRQNLITRHEFEQRARAVYGLAFEYSELPVEFSLNDNIIIYCNEHKHAFFCRAQDHLGGKVYETSMIAE
jgi:Pyruvate/2-oxoacid:ferredoxin oxidoreductase delta subunit